MSDTKSNIILIGNEEDLITFCNTSINFNTEIYIESIGTVYAIKNNDKMIDEMNSLFSYLGKKHKDIDISCIILLMNVHNYNEENVTSVLNCFEKVFGVKAEAIVCLIGEVNEEMVNEVKKIVKDVVIWNGSIPRELAVIVKTKSTRVSNLSELNEEVKKSNDNKSKTTSRRVILKHRSKASLKDGIIVEVLNLWEYNLSKWSNLVYILFCICYISWIIWFYLIWKHCWKYKPSFQWMIYFVLWLCFPYIFALGCTMCVPRLLEDKATLIVTAKNSPGFSKLKILQTETYLLKGELSEINHCDVSSEGSKIMLKSSVKIGWLGLYHIEYDLRCKILEEP